MAEIDEKGFFVKKTENEYFQELQNEHYKIDPDWNVDPSSPDGVKTAISAKVLAICDEVLQYVFSAQSLKGAQGQALDSTYYTTSGNKRQEGTASQVNLLLTGDPLSEIPAGSQVTDEQDTNIWATQEAVFISNTGDVTVLALCSDTGAITASADTITKIKTPVSGWQGVNNPENAVTGIARETDASLRRKAYLGVKVRGRGTFDSIIANVQLAEGVTDTDGRNNPTINTSPDGLPPNSYAIIAEGGSDEVVAEAIDGRRDAGVPMFAKNDAVSVDVPSKGSTNISTIIFSRPEYININIDLSVQNDGSLPLAGIEDELRTAILDYARGDFLDNPAEGFNNTGFSISESVNYSMLYSPINKVLGSYGNSYVTFLEINGGTGNIDVEFGEKASFLAENININIAS